MLSLISVALAPDPAYIPPCSNFRNVTNAIAIHVSTSCNVPRAKILKVQHLNIF